jgi:hypothetical protein
MADAVVVSGLWGKWGAVNLNVVEEGNKGVDEVVGELWAVELPVWWGMVGASKGGREALRGGKNRPA